MTEKLYDLDAYAKAFRAKVLSCEPAQKPARSEGEEPEKAFRTELDRTLFFPESGGQTPDRGSLVVQTESGMRKIAVRDVQIAGDRIFHYTDEALPEGAQVLGEIDWAHRFDNMQQHSGEHIFSGLVHSTFGYDNVGFHLSDNGVTLDFSGPLSEEDLRGIERRANRAIYDNLVIVISFPSPEELAGITYRSKKEIEGQMRLVTVPGIDVCACCAPHVHRTGEIGILKVVASQNYKGGTRVNILCGGRALDCFDADHALVVQTAEHFSTSADRIPERIAHLEAELAERKAELAEARFQLICAEAEQIPAEQHSVILFREEMPQEQMRHLVNALTAAHDGYCGVFAGNEAEGYRFIISIREGDARIALDKIKTVTQARGGGSPQMVQGLVSGGCGEAIRALWEEFQSRG
ncbi:MAG: alanyl-tRNA editing protein [Lachnospiraceae bacterium]|nr:alanyl-tRNA editing protein [Lachnospiraceae bacterium]